MRPLDPIGSEEDAIQAMALPRTPNYMNKQQWALPNAPAARAGANDHQRVKSRQGASLTPNTGQYRGQIGGNTKAEG